VATPDIYLVCIASALFYRFLGYMIVIVLDILGISEVFFARKYNLAHLLTSNILMNKDCRVSTDGCYDGFICFYYEIQ
jgi:hypothetical protein